ncbi:hypothetical protein [Rhizobium redzepovicii]
MTDISVTPANVLPGSNAGIDSGIAGETIAAGKTVYLNTTTNRWMLSDNNGTGTRQVNGIALNAASVGQPISIQKSGDITIGATIVAGQDYWLSGTPGGICPRADLTTGMDPVLVGIAKSTTVLAISAIDPGVTL